MMEPEKKIPSFLVKSKRAGGRRTVSKKQKAKPVSVTHMFPNYNKILTDEEETEQQKKKMKKQNEKF